MIVARHVDIIEENIICIGFDETLESGRGDQSDRGVDLRDDNVFQARMRMMNRNQK